jgi:hypothetical protein
MVFLQKQGLFVGCIVLLALLSGSLLSANAGALQVRLEQFPDWRSPPILLPAQGDLYYPDWMKGEWNVTSTLVDLAAPLAPEVVTPGFEANQANHGQPVTFSVRFGAASPTPQVLPRSPFPVGIVSPTTPGIVADRVYNGLSLATALLGQNAVQSIKIDPRSPNRQIAIFQNGQRLITQISGRGIETASETEFVSSELYQQSFRSKAKIYLNQVENTIAYRLISSNPPHIEADQVTAIYLSPQDPDYFKAKAQPVALYRYHLQFEPEKAEGQAQR